MVSLRSHSALVAASIPTSTAHSLQRSFVAEKPARHGRKRIKTEQEDAAATVVGAATAAKKPRKTTKREEETASVAAVEQTVLPLLPRGEVLKGTTIAYPTLPFNLLDAIKHLRSVDVRFHRLLDTVELTPYKELQDGSVKELDLFRTLTTSIMGQQVSWLAARAILYRFIRLFYPSLPEKPDFNLTPRESLPFPHPIDVDACTEDRLRSAGLSGAKVRYVKDIARRFSDGRLDVRKIVKLSEEECIEELVKIKGVGKWTAEMLLIFALRRANILPVGDLGVQRGMVLFYLSDANGPAVNKRKKKTTSEQDETHNIEQKADENGNVKEDVRVIESHLTASQSKDNEGNIAAVEAPILQTGPSLAAPKAKGETEKMQPLPESITVSLLKSRSEGKKAKGNVYLTPAEMESLAQPWSPFRSVATFLMWTCVDG